MQNKVLLQVSITNRKVWKVDQRGLGCDVMMYFGYGMHLLHLVVKKD